MPSTTRRQKAGRADRRAEIEKRLRAAIVRMGNEGETFTELSVERIVAEAGIARSTFYVYFEDKGALLIALGAASMRGFYDGARTWIDHGSGVPYDHVKEAMRQVLERFRDDAVIMSAVVETAVYDAAVREHYDSAVRDFIRSVRRLIERGQKSGEIRDVHPEATATALAWMLERTSQQTAPGASKRQLEASATGLADVVWGTLYA
jgi:TetR/AcrR family transcriptional regulator, ethionamide resistance regulator